MAGVEENPVESPSDPNNSDTENRIADFLEGLGTPDFERLLSRLPQTDRHIPIAVSPLERAAALLKYIRSSTGPGIPDLAQTLAILFPNKVSYKNGIFTVHPTALPNNTSQIRGLWNVPTQVPNFTGREEILNQLHVGLRDGGTMGLTQAISGLGGVGKTSVAVEYARRFASDYSTILWFDASSPDTLRGNYQELARHANLDWQDAPEIETIRQRALQFLEGNALHGDGKPALLIFDNADLVGDVLNWIPLQSQSCRLFTSRNNDLSEMEIAETLPLDVMTSDEAIEFLGKGAKLNVTTTENRAAAADLAAELQYLPLALAQAAAYMASPNLRCSVQEYLKHYQERRLKLLDYKRLPSNRYKVTIATTYDINFEQITGKPVLELLQCCAFLAPDRIPIEIFLENPEVFGSPLKEALEAIGDDETRWNELLEPATRYALLRYTDSNADDKADRLTLHIHRMVQEAIRDDIGDLYKSITDKYLPKNSL